MTADRIVATFPSIVDGRPTVQVRQPAGNNGWRVAIVDAAGDELGGDGATYYASPGAAIVEALKASSWAGAVMLELVGELELGNELLMAADYVEVEAILLERALGLTRVDVDLDDLIDVTAAAILDLPRARRESIELAARRLGKAANDRRDLLREQGRRT